MISHREDSGQVTGATSGKELVGVHSLFHIEVQKICHVIELLPNHACGTIIKVDSSSSQTGKIKHEAGFNFRSTSPV